MGDSGWAILVAVIQKTSKNSSVMRSCRPRGVPAPSSWRKTSARLQAAACSNSFFCTFIFPRTYKRLILPVSYGPAGFCGDGERSPASCLQLPRGMTADTNGNLYIADTGNQRVRKITPGGIISTFAGTAAGQDLDQALAPARPASEPPNQYQ